MALATILTLADWRTAPAALLVYEHLRRERVAQVQRGARENGLRYDSSYADSACAMPRSRPTRTSGNRFTITTWFRKPKRQPSPASLD